MTNKFEIEHLEGHGLTAVVTGTGRLYSTYSEFAVASGYSDAVAHKVGSPRDKQKRSNANRLLHKTVHLLAKGKHGSSNDTLYIVESVDDERFLFGASGLKIKEASGMVKVKSLNEIVGSLVGCGYTCEAGSLENNVDFRLLAQIAGFSAKPATDAPVGKIAVRTPQEIRDDIIEQAKRDVAELEANKPSVDVPHMLGYGRITLDNYSVEIIVNNEKRTIVALLRGNVSKEVRAKGIAKCVPTDCFNAHIGKAIALRRALGLEVPAEYLNAPQPTEVQVGDVVEYRSIISGLTALTISELIKNPSPSSYPGQAFHAQGILGWLADSQVTIIDDTRDEATK